MSDELSLVPLLADVLRLRARAGEAGAGTAALEDALRSLEQSVEELQVASDELQIKNEELILALGDLDEERRRYRDLFDLAVDGYVVTDARGVVVEANRAAGELIGRPAEALLGRRLGDLLAVESRAEVLRRVRLAEPGQDADAVLMLAAARGESRPVLVRYRRREDARSAAWSIHWTLTDLERPVFESETASGDDVGLARRWLGIYGELVAVTESLLDGATDRAEAASPEAGRHLRGTEVRPLEARLAHLRGRWSHWARRYRESVGLELEMEAAEVRYRDRVVEMTRRERQLLRFLVERPDTFHPPRVLLARAWRASYLSEEQLRTYVARLRRKLVQLGLPCELVTRRRRGYALLFR